VKLLIVFKIWRDGADEVRDKCHSLVDGFMDLISVECALLCLKCSKLVTIVTMLNLFNICIFFSCWRTRDCL
jgi:hypothetical protein